MKRIPDGIAQPEPRLKVWRDERAPFFRAEDTVVVRTGVGHMHAFNRPFGTCAIVKSPDPTLKGWAILKPSLRDEGEILWHWARDRRRGPEPLLKASRDERAPFFRAEDTMVVRTDVGHTHAFSRPCGTCAIVKSTYPTLKGWAILKPSLRDEGDIA